jgi:hypothetical protein
MILSNGSPKLLFPISPLLRHIRRRDVANVEVQLQSCVTRQYVCRWIASESSALESQVKRRLNVIQPLDSTVRLCPRSHVSHSCTVFSVARKSLLYLQDPRPCIPVQHRRGGHSSLCAMVMPLVEMRCLKRSSMLLRPTATSCVTDKSPVP